MNIHQIGFNAVHPDPGSGMYLLGNGYRSYHPALMRFHCPDSWSPFGVGGINPYVYCVGDPVNRGDATGHFSLAGGISTGLGLLGLLFTPVTGGVSLAVVAAGVASVGLGIAAEVIKDSKTADILGWAGMALGVASGVGGAMLSRAGAKATSLAGRIVSKIKGGWRGTHAVVTEEMEINALRQTRVAAARAYIAAPENFSHRFQIQANQGCVVSSMHISPHSRFINRFSGYYRQDLWKLMFLRRDPQISTFYADDIIDYQATAASRRCGYPLTGPRKIILDNVIHRELRHYSPGGYSPGDFLRSSSLGRMIDRIAQRYDRILTQVDVVDSPIRLEPLQSRIDIHLSFFPADGQFRYLPEPD